MFLMKDKFHKVMHVKDGSIAYELGIQQGDQLISINNQFVEDALDYHFLVDDDYLEVLILKDNGEEWLLEIEKDYDEELGIEFENDLMDEYKSCSNKCIFCFIDQLPKGMRDTLYFKDDDSRLSFLQGNYITLTNMKDRDVNRLIKYHLSPINISVHSMNMELRKKMLHNRFADRLVGYMKKFYDAGITMNGQIVLCKGINDGKELDYSIDNLRKFIPHMQSVSVVPVGLSKYREGLFKLELFTKEDAVEVLDIIHKWQDIIYEETGTHFIHAGDEFYLLADRPFPDEDNYDGYVQLENGVGMSRLLLDEFMLCYNEINTNEKLVRNVSIVTGTLAYSMIKNMIDKLKEKFPNVKVNIYSIINNFFGHNITVSGLLTGKDIIEQLKDKELGEELLLPCNLLRSGEETLLDDITVTDIENTLQVKVTVVKSTGQEFIRNILG
jgi:putative radical SAM enzyme (TIGR03279 family)